MPFGTSRRTSDAAGSDASADPDRRGDRRMSDTQYLRVYVGQLVRNRAEPVRPPLHPPNRVSYRLLDVAGRLPG
jgi:hypothetical protein